MTAQPFFSIVVSCEGVKDIRYFTRFLNSLSEQGLSEQDIEVIMSCSGDCSLIDEVISKSSLMISHPSSILPEGTKLGKILQTGAESATGSWIFFADIRDSFIPHRLNLIKQVIENTKEEHIVCSDFNKVDGQNLGKLIEEFKIDPQDLSMDSWRYGKFYNRVNFWEPYRLTFQENLDEFCDFSLASLVTAILKTRLDKYPTYVQLPVYTWIDDNTVGQNRDYSPKKVKNCKYDFVEVNFESYLKSQIDPILYGYEVNVLTRDDAISACLGLMMSANDWLYKFKQDHKRLYLKSSEKYVKDAWNRIKDQLNIDVTFAKVMLQTGFSSKLDAFDRKALSLNQPEFIEWLGYIDTTYDTTSDLNASEVQIEPEQLVSEESEQSEPEELEQPVKKERPFFSIIISCYNTGQYSEGKYLDRVLASLLVQDIDSSEFEVVVSDDCSPVSFNDVIEAYSDKLNIVYTKTEYNCCPGNTLQNGVNHSTGKWLYFVDHDDYLYEESLKKVRDVILTRNEQTFVVTDFYLVNSDGNVLDKYENFLGWCHGKFYNKDNFWDKYNLHFTKDMKTHEDTALCTYVSCILAGNHIEYTSVHIPTYAWTSNPASITHSEYDDAEHGIAPRSFLESHFDDYIEATGDTYIDAFKNHIVSIEYSIMRCIEVICYCYFYTQSFQFKRIDYLHSNIELAGKYVDKCKDVFNLTNASIYDVVKSNDAVLYCRVMVNANDAAGRYIPVETFKDWLDRVSPE